VIFLPPATVTLTFELDRKPGQGESPCQLNVWFKGHFVHFKVVAGHANTADWLLCLDQ